MAQLSSPTPDATTATKGKVQLAGDLGGTAASPSVLKLNGIGASGTPATGQVLIATSTSAATWQDISGLGGAWNTYTPTLANITTTTGTVVGRYRQIGKTVFYVIEFTLGASSAVGSAATFTLPVTSISYVVRQPIGMITYWDSSAGTGYPGQADWLTTGTARMDIPTITGTTIFLSATTSTTPFTWAVSDQIAIIGQYEAA